MPAPTSGNLTNVPAGGSWRRDAWENCDNGNVLFEHVSDVRHRTSEHGCASFMNGTDASSTFNHTSIGKTSYAALHDALMIRKAYHSTVFGSFDIERPWGLHQGGNTTQRLQPLSLFRQPNRTGCLICNRQEPLQCQRPAINGYPGRLLPLEGYFPRTFQRGNSHV